jgi:hypothetical protein
MYWETGRPQRRARRAIEGLLKLVSISLVVTTRAEVSLDVSREIDDITNEWDKIGGAHGKPTT